MKVIMVPTDRIVILGSNGVIGKDLVNYLSSCGKSFFELDRSKIDLLLSTSPNKIRSCLRPGDSIVVLAGITPSREKGYRALANNIKMMENVCLAINNSDISHVVYASSDAVYKTQTPKITEHSETHCSSDYSTMHLVREKMLMNTVSCSLSVLRITQVFSPQDSHNAYGPCRFIRAAKRNQSIQLYGDGADIRDHINVRDVSRAIACSVHKRIDGIINVASGNESSVIKI